MQIENRERIVWREFGETENLSSRKKRVKLKANRSCELIRELINSRSYRTGKSIRLRWKLELIKVAGQRETRNILQ